MPAPNAITPDKLARLVASVGAPHIIDLRDTPERAVPGSLFPDHSDPIRWGYGAGSAAVIVDADGSGAAASAAAILRSEGVAAEVLEGGFAAWTANALPTVSLGHLPLRHEDGRTWWVTRARPKVDRIACPWLIRRFVDPKARFLFVAPGEVLTVATQQRAEPFDVADEGVFWSHRGERCTFDVMVEAFGLDTHKPLVRLREQTIRDPLTGLFNRRYMEEAMTLEIARAARSGAPLSLVMCDVDHFKRFNDDHGHEAGDAVLQAVAAEMKSRFRDGDVVCRFGGEEFTVIAPGTSPEALLTRVEAVRQAIAELNVHQNGRTLGATSMSFGIASWHEAMARDGSSLIQAADAALYQAKREGRNRATISKMAA